MSDREIGEFIESEIPKEGDVVHAYGYRIENKGTLPVNIAPPKEMQIEFMKQYAGDNKMYLELEGTVGFGRECVGLIHNGQYPEYGYSFLENTDYMAPDYYDSDKYSANLDLMGPPEKVSDAYHKSDNLAVLGYEDDKIEQLYWWVKKLVDNDITVTKVVNQRAQGDPMVALIQGMHEARLVPRSVLNA